MTIAFVLVILGYWLGFASADADFIPDIVACVTLAIVVVMVILGFRSLL